MNKNFIPRMNATSTITTNNKVDKSKLGIEAVKSLASITLEASMLRGDDDLFLTQVLDVD